MLFAEDDGKRRQARIGDRLEAWLEDDSNSAIELRIRFDSTTKAAGQKPLKPSQPKPVKKPGAGEQNEASKPKKLKIPSS